MTMYCWSRSGSAATLNARETKMPTSQSGMRPAGRLRPVSLVAECTLVSPLGFFPRSDLSLPFVVTAPPPPLPQGEANTCTDGGIRPPFPWNSAAVRRRGGAMTPGGIKAFSSVRTSPLKRKTTTTNHNNNNNNRCLLARRALRSAGISRLLGEKDSAEVPKPTGSVQSSDLGAA